MLSLKIVGSILIIVSCYLFSEIAYNILKNRLRALKELHKVGRILKANIRYTGSDIEEVLENITLRVKDDIQVFIKEVLDQIKIREIADVSLIWNQAILNKLKDIRFSEDELLIIKRLGDNLGYMDKQMQIDSVELYLQELEEKIEILLDELRQKGKLYYTLGISFGIVIVLIII